MNTELLVNAAELAANEGIFPFLKKVSIYHKRGAFKAEEFRRTQWKAYQV